MSRKQVWIGAALVGAAAVVAVVLVAVNMPSSGGAATLTRQERTAAGATALCGSLSDPFFTQHVTVTAAYPTTIGRVVKWDVAANGGNQLSYTELPSSTGAVVCYLSGTFQNAAPVSGNTSGFSTEIVVVPAGGTGVLDMMTGPTQPFGPPTTVP